MKKLLLASAALAALTAGAQAADLGRTRTPISSAVVIPTDSWTGIYGGLHIGYGFGNSAYFPASNFKNGSGLLLGGQLGADYQVNSSFVVGAVVDASWTNVSEVQPVGVLYGIGWEGSARLRAGVLATPDFLIYGTGGLAYGTTYFTSVLRGNLGWTVGAGAEYRFTRNLSTFVEYRYTDFGTVLFGGPAPFGNTHHGVRVGLNYRFATGPSAVTAKY